MISGSCGEIPPGSARCNLPSHGGFFLPNAAEFPAALERTEKGEGAGFRAHDGAAISGQIPSEALPRLYSKGITHRLWHGGLADVGYGGFMVFPYFSHIPFFTDIIMMYAYYLITAILSANGVRRCREYGI